MSNKKSLKNTISDNLVYYRTQAHFTQDELAEKLGISVPHLANIERKKSGVSLSLIEKILKVFMITPNDLFLKKEPDAELSKEEKARILISQQFDKIKIAVCDELIKLELSEEEQTVYTTPIRPRTKKQSVASSKKIK